MATRDLMVFRVANCATTACMLFAITTAGILSAATSGCAPRTTRHAASSKSCYDSKATAHTSHVRAIRYRDVTLYNSPSIKSGFV